MTRTISKREGAMARSSGAEALPWRRLRFLLFSLLFISPLPRTSAFSVGGFVATSRKPVLRTTQRSVSNQFSSVSTTRFRSSLKASSDESDEECPQGYLENISIEYCPGCRWTAKAFWMATELLQSSVCRDRLGRVTIIPAEPGTFTISAGFGYGETETEETLWDRKVDGGFPPIDLIEFEDRVRSCLAKSAATVEEERDPWRPRLWHKTTHVVINYSEAYLLRAAYYGQELLTTFSQGEIEAVSLQLYTIGEGEEPEFSVDIKVPWEELPPPICLWSNDMEGGLFPEVKKLKQLVRDYAAHEMDLGHSESKTKSPGEETLEAPPTEELVDNAGDCLPCNSDTSNDDDDDDDDDDDGDDIDDDDDDDGFMDDDEAEEARRYFGVM